MAQTAAGQKRIAYRPRLPTRGRRRAAKSSARLRTITLPAQGFARYTATFSANACRRRKNDTVDTLRNPDGRQFLPDRIPLPPQTEPNDTSHVRRNRRAKIKISIRRHREGTGHPWILSDTDLASPSQSTFPDRHFTQRGLLFEARIDRSPSHLWYKAAAVQLSAFATDHIVGMKIPKCYCASAGAGDEETIKKYIESQKWDDDDQVFKITAPT